MVFYGASGHGKVIIEAWVLSGGTVTGIVDDNLEIKNLGPYSVSGSYNSGKFPGKHVIISIGNNHIRKRISEKVHGPYGQVFHPAATVSKSASIDIGTVLMAGVIINAASRIGRHVILNTASVIDHDCHIADFVHISPNATICGGVSIGDGTHIGAGATVIQNIKIGKWATIGAVSVVIEDVPDYAVIVGVPGKVIKISAPSSDERTTS